MIQNNGDHGLGNFISHQNGNEVFKSFPTVA